MEVTLNGFVAGRVTRAEVLEVPEGGDRFTANTEHDQEQVGLHPLAGVSIEGKRMSLRLPPLSWAVVEVEVSRG